MLWIKLIIAVMLLTILAVGSFWFFDSFSTKEIQPIVDRTVEETTVPEIHPAEVEEQPEPEQVLITGEEPKLERIRITEDLEGKITVSGRVINRACPGISDVDRPASGATVRCALAEDERTGEVFSKADLIADKLGRFSHCFDDPGVRPLFIRFTALEDDLYLWVIKRLPLPEGELSLSGVILTRFAYGPLVGKTVDDEGVPLAGVKVFAKSGEPETYSDAEGRFRLPRFERHGLRVSYEGYTLFHINNILRDQETGGWSPVRIVLVPSGRLWLHLKDSRGEALSGRDVRVWLSSAEPHACQSLDRGEKGRFHDVTDSNGTVRLEGLWSAKQLNITVELTGGRKETKCMDAGKLIFKRDEGIPIKIPRGGILELTAVETFQLSLHGTVYFPDHRPVPRPRVRVRDLDEKGWERRRMNLLLRGDDQGRYMVRIPEGAERHRLEVGALDNVGWGGYGTSFEHAVCVEVLTSEAEEGRIEQDLVLEPAYSISGYVLDEKGNPLRSLVRAVPSGSTCLWAETSFGLKSSDWASRAGDFHINGLAAGSYDLHVSQELSGSFSFPAAYHLFPGIEAGTEGLELVLHDKRNMNIRIHVETTGGKLKSLRVLHGKVLPRNSWKAPSREAARTMTVDSLGDWPAKVSLNFTGISSGEDARGLLKFGVYSTEEVSEHDLSPMEEGWYIIGVYGYDENKIPYFPVATKLMRFASGSYNLFFRLRPTATVEGRIEFQGERNDLFVSLRDQGGTALPLRVRAMRQATMLHVHTDGSFKLEHAPLGRFILCVGTTQDLTRGYPLVEQEVHIKAKDNPVLHIRLP